MRPMDASRGSFRLPGPVHLPCFARWRDQPGATGQPLWYSTKSPRPCRISRVSAFVQASGWRVGRVFCLCQRASHCALLRAIRGWPVGNEGAAPTHFARPDLATASTTATSQRAQTETRAACSITSGSARTARRTRLRSSAPSMARPLARHRNPRCDAAGMGRAPPKPSSGITIGGPLSRAGCVPLHAAPPNVPRRCGAVETGMYPIMCRH